MILDDRTREDRVKRWDVQKTAWEAKLEAAKNPNDTAVAKEMIAEAERALERLETKGEVVAEEDMYRKANVEKITKKVKADRIKHDSETPLKNKDDTSSIGV